MNDLTSETLDALADQEGNRGNGSLALSLEAHASSWAADQAELARLRELNSPSLDDVMPVVYLLEAAHALKELDFDLAVRVAGLQAMFAALEQS